MRIRNKVSVKLHTEVKPSNNYTIFYIENARCLKLSLLSNLTIFLIYIDQLYYFISWKSSICPGLESPKKRFLNKIFSVQSLYPRLPPSFPPRFPPRFTQRLTPRFPPRLPTMLPPSLPQKLPPRFPPNLPTRMYLWLPKAVSSKFLTKQPRTVPTSHLVVSLWLYIFGIVCS